MNSRFLASPGGRLANLTLSLAFLVMAYAAFVGGPAAVRVSAAGVVALIVGFVAATLLSIRDFRGYALAITLLVPPVAFYYLLGLHVLGNEGPAGSAAASAIATVGAFVFLGGTVLGLRTLTAPQPPTGPGVLPAATSKAGA